MTRAAVLAMASAITTAPAARYGHSASPKSWKRSRAGEAISQMPASVRVAAAQPGLRVKVARANSKVIAALMAHFQAAAPVVSARQAHVADVRAIAVTRISRSTRLCWRSPG